MTNKLTHYPDSLINGKDLWYSAPKKNAQERTESALNCALKLLANWCDNNGMVINTAKTAFQTFSLARHSINPLLRYKDTTIERTNEFTYLGMTFDTRLTWKSHIAKIAERVSNRLNVLKRLAGSVWGCARSTLNTTYKMFIQPIMLYCGGHTQRFPSIFSSVHLHVVRRLLKQKKCMDRMHPQKKAMHGLCEAHANDQIVRVIETF
ncbi:unnamed protein product [Rodentolepis nana]|uniref:Tick transposon n=1 Tax=Rodentolepis nana TaxID=102285 RepID=A0A0R3TV28_RODNA|nr:unnamed protein product [Rodentolepis nana]